MEVKVKNSQGDILRALPDISESVAFLLVFVCLFCFLTLSAPLVQILECSR